MGIFQEKLSGNARLRNGCLRKRNVILLVFSRCSNVVDTKIQKILQIKALCDLMLCGISSSLVFSSQNTLPHLNPLQGPGICLFKTIFESQLCAQANDNKTEEVLALLGIISGHGKRFKGNK